MSDSSVSAVDSDIRLIPQTQRPPCMLAVGAICNSSIYRVEEVPPLPSKVLASEMCQVVDGMALSAAYAFVRLGGSAGICARVGDDALGQSMQLTLAAEGLDTSGLYRVPGTLTSQATVVVDRHGDRLVVPYHDSRVDKSPDWLPLERLANADILHCDARWVEGSEAASYVMKKIDIPMAPIVLTYVLGAMMEKALLQSVKMNNGSLIGLIESPISLFMLILAAIVFGSSVYRNPEEFKKFAESQFVFFNDLLSKTDLGK